MSSHFVLKKKKNNTHFYKYTNIPFDKHSIICIYYDTKKPSGNCIQKGDTMNKLKTQDFIPLFESQQCFSVTESQYKEMTGRTIPKTIKESAIDRFAKTMGFTVTENTHERVLVFTRKEK